MAALLRTRTELPDGIRLERLVACGSSQSAARLLTYINAIQPLTSAFDAFLLGVHWGCGAPLSVGGAGPLPSMMHLGESPWNFRTYVSRIRTDLAPVL